MDDLISKLREATAVYAGLRAYKLVLDLAISFLAASILLQIIGFQMIYSLIPAGIYVLIQLALELRRMNVIKRIGGRYHGLDESLETAYEYRDADNIIVQSLMSDVSKEMDNVESSTFFDQREITRRVIVTIVLLFVMMTITVLDLRGALIDFMVDNTNLGRDLNDKYGDAKNQFQTMFGDRWEQSNWTTDKEKEKLGAESGGDRPGISEGPIPGTGGGVGSDSGKDIYGKASSANINGENVQFQLHPEYGGEIEIRESGGRIVQNKFELATVESAETCDECVIGPEHEEVVRKYFEKILAENK
ncbi:MAG: hypothetical protein ABIH11_04940 [Candidatus Altiarchaeota archaeon]